MKSKLNDMRIYFDSISTGRQGRKFQTLQDEELPIVDLSNSLQQFRISFMELDDYNDRPVVKALMSLENESWVCRP